MLSKYLPGLKKQSLSFIAELTTEDGKERELMLFPTINMHGHHCFDRWTVGNYFGVTDLVESGFTTRGALMLARGMADITDHFSDIAKYEPDVNRAYNRVRSLGNTVMFPVCDNGFEKELFLETMRKLGVESFPLKSREAKSWYEPDGYAFKYPRLNDPDSENAINDLAMYIKSFLSERDYNHTKADEWKISIVISGKLVYSEIKEVNNFLDEQNLRKSLVNVSAVIGFAF